MIKSIKLNNELVSKVNSGSIKAMDMVKFLASVEGITYNKELALENVSINMLVIDGHKVGSAEVDTWENEIVLTLSDEVVTTPEARDKGLFKAGIEFYTIDGKFTVKEYLEQFKMYAVMENNKIFKHEEIQRYIDNEELTKAKLERSRLKNIEIQEQLQKEKEIEEQKQLEYNFCYGYICDKTDLQKGKILKTLNKNIVYHDELMTRKQFIHKMIRESDECKTEIYNNTNRCTSKRINLEYKKLVDKVEYRFYTDDSFIEVTKTEYDYISYLLARE
jgi:hypothetical protein